jgi:exonuclease SbcC
MERLEDDARRRGALEPRLDAAGVKEAELKKVITEWPRVEERVQGLFQQAENGQKQLAALEQELREAGAVLEARRQRELLERARPLQEQITAIEAALAALPLVGKAELAFLEQKLQELARLKSVAEAMKLKARFRTNKPLELLVTAGLEEPRRLPVEAEASLEGAGRLLLEGPGWTLEVQSGEGDVTQLLERARRARADFEAKLKELAVKEIGEARAVRVKYEELEKALEGARIRLEGYLGGITFSALEAAAANLGPDKPVRDPELIKGAAGELKVSLGALKVKLEQEQEKLKSWTAVFESLDSAVEAMAELKRQALEIKKELEALAPLPAEFGSADKFIDALKEMRGRRDALKDQIAGLKVKLIEAQSRLPEESTEELAAALRLAGEELARLKRQGEAIRLVRAEFSALKAEMDSDTLAPLAKSFAHNLAVVTNNRYTAARLDGAVPGAISSGDGRALPVELLSTGTAGGAALALRLAMAAYLLKEAGGFLVMDDPLVNLDPERKKAAAILIREFAREKQLIVTTCDPATAALLGGNVIAVHN